MQGAVAVPDTEVQVMARSVPGVWGGGGNAGISADATTRNGTVNTGGGGGASRNAGLTGGSGGSGVVIISYASTTQRGSGGTITSYISGGTTYWVHTFTSSGTFTT